MFKRVILISLLVFFTMPFSVVAQENTTESNNTDVSSLPQDQVISLEFIQQVQDPYTLNFDYVVKVKTLIDTNRLRLNWEIVNKNIVPVGTTNLSDAIDIKKDQEVFITKTFRPIRAGSEEIRITGISFGDRDDHYSYHKTDLIINQDLLIAANREDYKTAVSIKNILSVSRVAIIAFDIMLIILIIFWRFKLWIDKD